MKNELKLVNFRIWFVALMVISLTGCEKYEEGGLVSKADDRLVANSWVLSTYLSNGKNETSNLLIADFTETFSESGSFTRSYIDTDGSPFSETGTWQFATDKLQIKLTGVSSVELTDENTTVSSSDYDIVRLKKDEFWYGYENGGDYHEFHMVPK